LEGLFVTPTERSQGAGQAIMNELASDAQKSFCSHLHWLCDVRNQVGLKFYNRIGATVQSQKGDMYNYQWVPSTWSNTL
jgi:GNAT superfamily N-acetyltransferase